MMQAAAASATQSGQRQAPLLPARGNGLAARAQCTQLTLLRCRRPGVPLALAAHASLPGSGHAWLGPRSTASQRHSRRGGRPAHPTRTRALPPLAMVNVDFASPSLVLGVVLIGCGVLLLQLRNLQTRVSRDADIVVAAMISIVGSTLIFQGWRLDPLLLLCQALTTSVAVWYGIETFRLRSREEEVDAAARQAGLLPPGEEGGWGPASNLYSDGQQPAALPPVEQPQPLQQPAASGGGLFGLFKSRGGGSQGQQQGPPPAYGEAPLPNVLLPPAQESAYYPWTDINGTPAGAAGGPYGSDMYTSNAPGVGMQYQGDPSIAYGWPPPPPQQQQQWDAPGPDDGAQGYPGGWDGGAYGPPGGAYPPQPVYGAPGYEQAPPYDEGYATAPQDGSPAPGQAWAAAAPSQRPPNATVGAQAPAAAAPGRVAPRVVEQIDDWE